MKGTANQTYNIPIVPPDLRREEAVRQICDSLSYLDKVADDVFSRISQRVKENHDKLRAVNKRIDLAQAKIDKIKGSNKATKVFSSAKYPAEDEEESYVSAYNQTNMPAEPKHPNYRLQSKHQVVDSQVLKDKLQFYNVQLNLKKHQHSEDCNGEGLGRLPRNIPSVSSLLLFNTSENPYKKYVLLDPLGVVTKTRTALDEKDDGPAEAPSTITQREEMQRVTTENYFYMPGLGEVPEIAVPEFLPDLVGVADDLSYSADMEPSIAPSVPGTAIPDLPSMVPETELIIPEGPARPGSSTAPTLTDIPPPPPPPMEPPPPIEPSPTVDRTPPPPPPPASPPPPAEDQTDSTSPAAPSGKADTSRASFLESIRQAGGAGQAKLRSPNERKIESKKKKQEEKMPSGGGDLMGDLAAKLALRRKGISGPLKANPGGAQANSDGTRTASIGGGLAMDRISAMIPPPPMSEEGGADHSWE